MAKQKALFTTANDFATNEGYGEYVVSPLLLFNNDTENVGTFSTIGTAVTENDIGKGVRKKAIKFGKVRSMLANPVVYPASNRYMLSVWVKPSATDVLPTKSGGQTFAMIATNRSSLNSNRGMHLTINNDATKGAMLNVRMYHATTTASLDMYSNGTTQALKLFNFEADKWYHIVVRYDETEANRIAVFINGERFMYNAGTTLNMSAGWTSAFGIGDMYGTSSVKLDGMTDEVYYAHGANVWDDATILAYYNSIAINPSEIDNYTNSGSIQLPKNLAGEYTQEVVTWSSPTIDLVKPFEQYGRVQVNGTFPSTTNTKVSTLSSDDGISWGTAVAINATGTIMSSNKRFLKVEVQIFTTTGSETPVIDEIQILDYSVSRERSLKAEPLRVFKDLDSGMVSMGEAKNAYDIIIGEQVNGEDILTFKLPINDPKRNELGSEPVETAVQIGKRVYTIKEAKDNREEDGRLYTEFTCEARFYELRDHKVMIVENENVTAEEAIRSTLSASLTPTGWTVGTVKPPSINRRRDIKAEWKSVLEILRTITETFGGEMYFNESEKTINLVSKTGNDNGVRFYYNKNLKKVVRTIDTYDLVTRLYVYGKGRLSISTVNNGLEYIENTEWVEKLGLRNKIRVGSWIDQSYTIPANLLEDGQQILDDSSKPRFAYVIGIQDLSSLSGHEDEAIGLGDTVYTVDKTLFSTEEKFEVKSRIIRRQYNVREPWKTVVELNQPTRLLQDAQQRAIDDQLQTLTEIDPLDAADVTQMTVFNSLLNSRAEEGISSAWSYTGDGTGFEVANAGFSGEWAFKLTGAYGKTNSLTQRVNGVSHRTAYTVSTMVANAGTVTRGSSADSFVGIKVVINYTDGTNEVKYLSMKDNTTTDGGIA